MDMPISRYSLSEASDNFVKESWGFDYISRRVGPRNMVSTFLPAASGLQGRVSYTYEYNSGVDLLVQY